MEGEGMKGEEEIDGDVEAAGRSEDDARGDDEFEDLVEAIAAAIERKRRLLRLDGMLQKLDSALNVEEGVTEPTVQMTIVKGEVLLKRHLKMGGEELREYLKKAGGRMNGEMLRIIGEEMRRAQGEVKGMLFEFVRALLQREGEKVVKSLDGIIVELCERDVRLFDMYISLLLRWMEEAREGEEVVRLVAEGKMSVRRAAKEKMRKGGIGEDEVRRRLRELMGRRG